MKDYQLQKIFLSVAAACFAGIVCCAQPAVPDSILKTLKPLHPRLLVSSLQDFEDIKTRSRNDSFLARTMTNVLRNADSVLVQPAVTYRFMDAFRLDTRTVNSHVHVLATAYRLTGEKKYADRLWTDLEAVSRFPDWNPRHFLDCALMLQPVAVAYDWLYDVWTPEQRRVLKQQIISKGLLESLVYYDGLVGPKGFDWSAVEHNWSLVCNGNMAMGALAIADEEPQLANRILRESLTRLPKAIRHFGPDGAWDEGPGYWAFAMRATVPILSSLQSAVGTDFGFTNIPGFSRAGAFYLSLGGAGGVGFNYADANASVTRSPELLWLAERFAQPTLSTEYITYADKQQAKGRSTSSPFELLWYRPASAGQKALPLANYFRGAEVATLRSGWRDEDWFVGFKAGDNAANHSHLDAGSFVLDWNGVRWISDLGPNNYNVPGYFGDVGRKGKRWSYYRTRAEGQNTLVINPGMFEDQDIYAKTVVERFDSSASPFGIMNLTDAYKESATSVKRGIRLAKGGVWVQDELAAKDLSDLWWFAHTKAAITLSDGGKKALLEQDGKKLVAIIRSPAGAVFQVMDAVPLPTSPQPAENSKNEGTRKLAIRLANTKTATIAVEFSGPEGKGNTPVKSLATW